MYNKILFLNSLHSGRLEVVGTRKNGRVCVHYFQASATLATTFSKPHAAHLASKGDTMNWSMASLILREPAARQ